MDPEHQGGGFPSGRHEAAVPFQCRSRPGGNSRNKRRPNVCRNHERSYHPGGVNVLFGDGSVRFIKETINGNTWRALGSVNGSEIISADQY